MTQSMAPRLALILAFFIGAPQVSGFGHALVGKSNAANPDNYMVDKYNPDGSCKGPVVNGFCYPTDSMQGYCEYLADGCIASGGSAKSCQNYDWYVETEACPSLQGAGTSNFCMELTQYTALAPNVWCSSLNGQGEAACESHYIHWTNADGAETYQQCVFNAKNSKCKSNKQKIGGVNYGVVQHCGNFCLMDRTNMNSVSPFYCATGDLSDFSKGGLQERLTDPSVCTNSYSTSAATGGLLQCTYGGGTPGCAVGSSCACKEGQYQDHGCMPMSELCCIGENCEICADL